jgi:hypothetical protein
MFPAIAAVVPLFLPQLSLIQIFTLAIVGLDTIGTYMEALNGMTGKIHTTTPRGIIKLGLTWDLRYVQPAVYKALTRLFTA